MCSQLAVSDTEKKIDWDDSDGVDQRQKEFG
jgi:hypothetical protein